MNENTKIMVVDDEERICRNIEKILARNNFDVVTATSADEALERMAKESFSLLISDIVMPGMNGLELLKLVKKEAPLTKAVIMTAYASTDTAVKAIRLGALDYIPKPFTPDELRSLVDRALSGEIVEAHVDDIEKEEIDVIDLDIPFDPAEVEKQTGEGYSRSIGPSDMPVVEAKVSETLENYCAVGDMVCDIFKKLGTTCKSGAKKAECPRLKAKKSKEAEKAGGIDMGKFIGVDLPFDYEEVVAVTGPEYARRLHNEGVSFVPYEELKKSAARAAAQQRRRIDEDIPFNSDEVSSQTGAAYAKRLGPSDMPSAESVSPENLENYCKLGDRVCDIFKKLGMTCKAGLKKSVCPQDKGKAAATAPAFDSARLVSIDQPFDYEEMVEATGAEYVAGLHREGFSIRPYEALKRDMARFMEGRNRPKIVYGGVKNEPAYRHILVIDDEVAVNNNIRKILTKKGYHVDQAVSKAEAVEKISERPYRVILLDLKIPGVKGLELLETIRNKNPEAKVVIITGYSTIETAVECARLGAIDYLSKPFTTDEIRNVTEKAYEIAA